MSFFAINRSETVIKLALVQAFDLQLAPAAKELGPPSRLPRGNRGPKAITGTTWGRDNTAFLING